jgi:hypothetical protein
LYAAPRSRGAVGRDPRVFPDLVLHTFNHHWRTDDVC